MSVFNIIPGSGMRRGAVYLARAARLASQRYNELETPAMRSNEQLPFSARPLIPGPRLQSTIAADGSSSSSSATDTSTRNASGEDAPTSQGQKDLVAIFTCGKCDTRSAKAFSRAAYERGVVIARCPGCQNLHLLSDQLGWFGQVGLTVEDFLAERGEEVRRRSETGTLEITEEDIVGWTTKS